MVHPWLLLKVAALWSVSPVTIVAKVHHDPSSRFDKFADERYVRQDRADPEHVVPLIIGVFPGDFDALEREFYVVSDPTQPQYGQYLIQEQADVLSCPVDGALDAVRDWVADCSHDENGGTFLPTSNLYKVPMKVKHIERLLNTELYHYEAKRTDAKSPLKQRRLMRATSALSVPEHLEDVVSFLSVNTHPLGLRALGVASSQHVAEMDDESEGGTLETIRRTYGIPDGLVATNPSNMQCVSSFFNESYDPEDLSTFFEQFLPGEDVPRIIEKGSRVNQPEQASTEASLDVQYLTGVCRNATTFVWTMNGSNPYSSEDEPFVEFAEEVLALENPPLVISISYADDEEHIFDVSPGYARTLDILLIKMGLRGITVLIASGDDGVTGLRPEFMKIPVEDMCEQSGPEWPSSSPYITTVGATMLLTGVREAIKPFYRTKEEVVCSVEDGGIITSGGGFSNIYPMPDYQRTAVERYLTTRDIPAAPGFFNASGRAYPDVSALGKRFQVYMNGHLASVSGTSASTPVMGAMVTLWNDARLNAGKSPLGFINPLLYYLAETHVDAFHDVVVGNNGAARGKTDPCENAFSAAAGWDAVSGVGTPNFSVVLEFITNLEDHFNVSRLGGSSNADVPDTSNNSVIPTTVFAGKSVFTMMLLVAVVVANVAISMVVVITLVKRWRYQYTPLANVAASSNTPTVSASGTSSAAFGRTQRDSDADSSEGDAELTEISLNP
uniref:subtilisin n=1 Tax=Hyaloperonospora arabidopsidis (strain Emoy2) TaxID=559515 RepID=M4BFP3_HYAAE